MAPTWIALHWNCVLLIWVVQLSVVAGGSLTKANEPKTKTNASTSTNYEKQDHHSKTWQMGDKNLSDKDPYCLKNVLQSHQQLVNKILQKILVLLKDKTYPWGRTSVSRIFSRTTEAAVKAFKWVSMRICVTLLLSIDWEKITQMLI